MSKDSVADPISFRSYRDACIQQNEGKVIDKKIIYYLERDEQTIRASFYQPKAFIDAGLYSSYFIGTDYKVAWEAIQIVVKHLPYDCQIQPNSILSEMRRMDSKFHGKAGTLWINQLMNEQGADWKYVLRTVVPEIVCRNRNQSIGERFKAIAENASKSMDPVETYQEWMSESARIANDAVCTELGNPSSWIKWDPNKDAADNHHIVPTGVRQIDDNAGGGHRRGDLMVVGGGTNTGKSFFAEMLCNNVSTSNRTILYVSVEDNLDIMFSRMVARYTSPRARPMEINARLTNPSTVQSAMDSMKEKHGDRAILLHAKKWTISQICAAISQHKYMLGIDMVIVDYLQAVQPDSPGGNRVQEVGEVVSRLKKCADNLNVAMVVMSQFSRDEYRDGQEPGISACKFAGEIENESEIMVLMWRDENDLLHAKMAKIKWAQSRDLRYLIETDPVTGSFGNWVDDLTPKEEKNKNVRKIR